MRLRGPMFALAVASQAFASQSEQGALIRALNDNVLSELVTNLSPGAPQRQLQVTSVQGDVQDRRAAGFLLDAYAKTQEPGVRCKLLESIGRLRDETHLAWLEERVEKEQHLAVRCFATWAIGELRTPKSRTSLRRALYSGRPELETIALDALGKTGRDPALASEIARHLDSPDVQRRFVAAKAMAGAGNGDWVSTLIERISRENSVQVQENLAVAIGRIGGESADYYLMELLKNPPTPVMEHLAEIGLVAGDRKRVWQLLAPHRESPDLRLRISVSRIIAALGSVPE
jgi:HEAT repeat protein